MQNSDGTFTDHSVFLAVPQGYGFLDLYAMGLMRPEEVPDFFSLENMQPIFVDGQWAVSADKKVKWGIHLTQVAPRRCGLVDPQTPARCTQNAPWGARRRPERRLGHEATFRAYQRSRTRHGHRRLENMVLSASLSGGRQWPTTVSCSHLSQVDTPLKVISIDQVIAAMGPRLPPASDSQKSFSTAFILVVPNGTQPTGEDLNKVEGIRLQWEEHFRRATAGRATMSTTLVTAPAPRRFMPPRSRMGRR